MAVTDAVHRGQQAVLCASTGNMIRVRRGLCGAPESRARVLIPQGKIANGQARTSRHARAKIIQIDGNFDDCLSWPAS